jgi:hypothetical protein
LNLFGLVLNLLQILCLNPKRKGNDKEGKNITKRLYAQQPRPDLQVEDEGLLKDLIVIFIFLGVLCTLHYFF